MSTNSKRNTAADFRDAHHNGINTFACGAADTAPKNADDCDDGSPQQTDRQEILPPYQIME